MRTAHKKRDTRETQIDVKVNLDGKGDYSVDTPYGFFNHMLELLSKHSGIDMEIKASGDTEVDPHHTVEDVGIVLARAIDEALGDRKGIERYASIMLPMDATRCDVALDLGGRANLVYKINENMKSEKKIDFTLLRSFMKAFADNLKATLHIQLAYDEGDFHHAAESIFKGLARSLKKAIEITGEDLPSSKGVM